MTFATWSQTASSNTSVGGISTDGTVTLVKQIDNMFRGMMAELAVARDDGTILAVPPRVAQAQNLIVNPAMQVSQENGTSAGGANGYFAADQWDDGFVTSTGVVSFAQVASVTPRKSANRIRLSVSTADTSLAAGEFLFIRQKIEGLRLANLGWNGTTGTQLVLRFGFKGPAGTYSMSYQNAAATRSWVSNFTVTAPQANTDVEITKTIPADTTGGTWPATTAQGSQLVIALAAGSTFQTTADAWQTGNFIGTSATSNGLGANTNVFELFDVGLYPDPSSYGVAPAWIAPSYADDLAACMRYFYQAPTNTSFAGYAATVGAAFGSLRLPVPMRVVPTASFPTALANYTVCFGTTATASNVAPNSPPSNFSNGVQAIGVQFNTPATLTAGQGVVLTTNSAVINISSRM